MKPPALDLKLEPNGIRTEGLSYVPSEELNHHLANKPPTSSQGDAFESYLARELPELFQLQAVTRMFNDVQVVSIQGLHGWGVWGLALGFTEIRVGSTGLVRIVVWLLALETGAQSGVQVSCVRLELTGV